jgi:hypothetical protein
MWVQDILDSLRGGEKRKKKEKKYQVDILIHLETNPLVLTLCDLTILTPQI